MPRFLTGAIVFAAILGMALPCSPAGAQQRVIRVMGDDGQPVAYANVTVAGERPRITNEKGEVEIGSASRPEFSADVRRLGYESWSGKLALGDTVTSALVTVHRLSRRLLKVTITDSSRGISANLRGFYERMLARQRGVGSGVYLTPEEVDKHNAVAASALLNGQNGVSLQRTANGKTVAMSSGGSCQMTVLIDGRRACPDNGCNSSSSAQPPPDNSTGPPRRGTRQAVVPPPPRDEEFVLLDNLVAVSEIAAVEIYPRGASIPSSLPTPDGSCGLIAFWTGERRAP